MTFAFLLVHLISYLLLPSALQWTVWFAVAVAGGLLAVVIILVFWFIVRKTEETTPGKLLAGCVCVCVCVCVPDEGKRLGP